MAHLKAVETKKDYDSRYRWKLSLIKRLYRLGYDREQVINLFEFIDWVMSLPEGLEKNLWHEISRIEEETKMQYVSSVERIGMEKGIKKALETLMTQKFQVSPDFTESLFSGLTTRQLEKLLLKFSHAENPEELREFADELKKMSPRDTAR